jgi:hypothetical protein
MPSLLYWRLRIPHPLSVWLSGWSGSGVGLVASILHRYPWLSNSGLLTKSLVLSLCVLSVHVARFITKKALRYLTISCSSQTAYYSIGYR